MPVASIPKPTALSCMYPSSLLSLKKARSLVVSRVDQRGSGKSTPLSELRDNTTQALISDLAAVRSFLRISAPWIVFGGSWGSTLALAYAQAHPDHVRALVLRGIFALRKEELHFFYQGPGSSFFFPEEWKRYVSVIPENERGDMIGAYYRRLTSDDAQERKVAGQAWARWEMATSHLIVSPEDLNKADEEDFADAFARIEAHFFFNKGFFPEDGWILKKEQVDKIRHIPATIVQGRYDLVCPAHTAFKLHEVRRRESVGC